VFFREIPEPPLFEEKNQNGVEFQTANYCIGKDLKLDPNAKDSF
jgi:hypothetical protein